MSTIVVPNSAPQMGPGYLYRAVIGSTLPTFTVAGSKFTDAWPAAWIPVGMTREGSTFTYELTTDTMVVAEYLDPILIQPTGRNVGCAFDVAQITNQTYRMGYNGGTSSTVSGTGATLLTKLDPPAVGAEVRLMLGWESQDETERVIYYQCLQSGSISMSNQKAPNFKSVPLTFRAEQPASGQPFSHWFAGAARVAAA